MKNRSISFIIVFAIFVVAASCNQVKDVTYVTEKVKLVNMEDEMAQNIPVVFDSTGYILLQNNCMSCHSAAGKTHDELIAPPIIAIKRRYLMAYNEREEFIKTIVDWAKDPKEENGIMRGAINKFKTMPYMNFKEEDLNKIAAFIYDNAMEKPDWFEEHFREMHPDGKMRIRRGQKKI